MANSSTGNALGRMLPTLNTFISLFLVAALFSLLSGVKFGSFGDAATVEPLGVHLALTAFLLFAVTSQMIQNKPTAPGIWPLFFLITLRTPLVVIGFVNIALAFSAVSQLSSDNSWIVWFAVPGALSIWTYFAYDKRREQVEASLEVSDSEYLGDRSNSATPNEADVAAAESKPTPKATLLAHIYTGIFFSIYWGAFLSFIGMGAYYHTVLARALFRDDFTGWGSISQLVDFLTESVGPSAIGIVVAVLLIYVIIGAAMALWHWWEIRNYKGADRELSPEEISLIGDASASVESYLAQIRKNWFIIGLYWLSFGVILAPFFAAIFLLGDQGLGASLFESARTSGLEWYIYNDGVGFADVVIIFTVTVFAVMLLIYLGVVWPEFGEHSYLLAKRQTDNNNNPAEQMRAAIATAVRRKEITSMASFDPKTFLHSTQKMIFKYCAMAVIAMTAFNAVFWTFDRMDYTLISEDRVLYSDYWTFKRYNSNYADIKSIELSCKYDDDDVLFLRYSFKMSDDRAVTVAYFNSPKALRDQLGSKLENWKRADALARDAGVKAKAATFKPFGRKEAQIQFSHDDCSKELEQILDYSTSRDVLQLLMH